MPKKANLNKSSPNKREEGVQSISFLLTENNKANQTPKKIVLPTRPQPKKGINLIKKPENFPIFQTILKTQLASKNCEALWIDSGNQSSTYALSNNTNPQILEKVKIARAFTPFQHYTLVKKLEKKIQNHTKLIILPQITSLYLKDQLNNRERQELFEKTWKKIKQLQKNQELKILVSITSESNSIDQKILEDRGHTIKAEKTSQGIKYKSENYIQQKYGKNNQTKLKTWEKEFKKQKQGKKWEEPIQLTETT